MNAYYALIIDKGEVCIYYCVESLELLVVSNSIERVLRLRRCEARVATIGFTLFYIPKFELQFFPTSSFSKLNARQEPKASN